MTTFSNSMIAWYGPFNGDVQSWVRGLDYKLMERYTNYLDNPDAKDYSLKEFVILLYQQEKRTRIT